MVPSKVNTLSVTKVVAKTVLFHCGFKISQRAHIVYNVYKSILSPQLHTVGYRILTKHVFTNTLVPVAAAEIRT
jgi:hypothetical protein